MGITKLALKWTGANCQPPSGWTEAEVIDFEWEGTSLNNAATDTDTLNLYSILQVSVVLYTKLESWNPCHEGRLALSPSRNDA